MTERKLPQRRCIGCNRQGEKRSFVRIVRTPDGRIILDKTGKENGRGVYICNDKKCLEKAKKNRRADKSFEIPVPDEVYAEIEKSIGEENE